MSEEQLRALLDVLEELVTSATDPPPSSEPVAERARDLVAEVIALRAEVAAQRPVVEAVGRYEGLVIAARDAEATLRWLAEHPTVHGGPRHLSVRAGEELRAILADALAALDADAAREG
jgi:hypothetical protein